MDNEENKERIEEETVEGTEGEENEARARELLAQAQAIGEAGGPDMMQAFREDATVREKVLAGDWDFAIAYGYLLGKQQARRSVPAAVRAPNNAGTAKRVATLSEAELEALDARIARGETIDPDRI